MSVPSAFGLLMLGLFIVGFVKKTGLVAGAIWFEAVLPERYQRVCAAYQRRGTHCLLVGAGVGLPACIAAAGLLLLGGPGLRLFGAALLLVVLFLLVYGHGAAYLDTGQRLRGAFGAEGASAKILVGGATLEMAFLAPVAGQILAAVVWMRCFGAAVLELVGAAVPEN